MLAQLKKSFVRGVWGIYDVGNKKGKSYSRRSKIDNDILLSTLNPYEPPYKVYIFGEENFKKLTDMGFDTVLIDKKPICWDMEKEQYRHKMEIWKAGLQDFDEIVFLDFDCIPCKKIPDDFWGVMGQGEPIKTPIYVYHLRRVNRPPNDFRKVSSASFVYIRGKEHADGIIKLWEETGKPWKEEYTLTLYIDNLSGGWKGVEGYKKHDVQYYQMSNIPGLEKDRSKFIFGHFNYKVINGIIGDRKNIKDRIDAIGKSL